MKKVNVKQGSKVFCKKFLIAGFALAFIIAVSIICAFAAGGGHTQKVAAENPVRRLEQKSGFIRTVNQNEYSFFKQIAEKNTDSKTNLQDVENETKKIINQVNAEFYIANQLELCGPYSFESLQRDMDKEQFS
ncbi:MAG: hypothetical protein E7519_03480 [Ruminococcaceae bacterium]|nr:hypothetical protein [Oscillospiraceae bacterium]